MILQPRDENLLRKLSHYGVLSTRQVQTLTFAGVSHSTMMRRLRTLERSFLIVRVQGLDEGLHAWTLAARGAETIGAGSPFRYTNRNATQHEVALSSVRMRLEGLGYAKDWIGEMTIKRRQGSQSYRRSNAERLIPDGIFTASFRNKLEVIAVELELHAKARARYEKLFEQYAKKTALDFIWYIARTESIGRLVLDAWQKVPGYLKTGDAPALGYTLLDNLLADPKSMQLHQLKAAPLRFCEVFCPSVTPEPEKPKERANMLPPAQTPAQGLGRESTAVA